mmetsp:Transcript_6674/g.14429  ORF Transcript_6674/g.14429 Transcript_6674/m.14429 type:complete len:263 (+) Transcript_6674:208-996(+)
MLKMAGFSRSSVLLALIAITAATTSNAFVSHFTHQICKQAAPSTHHTFVFPAKNEDANEGNDEPHLAIALPPIGASSFSNRDQPPNVVKNENDDKKTSPLDDKPSINNPSNEISISDRHQYGIVAPKFQLQYTCKVCTTRNTHSVSRKAYRQGVVIAVCKGCESKHLIADNLGWSNYIGGFDFDGGETNIEEFMKNRKEEQSMEEVMTRGIDEWKGEEDLVMRVKPEVFDLEKVLYQSPEENVSSGSVGNGHDDQHLESSWN